MSGPDRRIWKRGEFLGPFLISWTLAAPVGEWLADRVRPRARPPLALDLKVVCDALGALPDGDELALDAGPTTIE